MQSSRTPIVLLIALVAAVIGGVATYGVSALTSTAKTEVRISAQRLDDGRVEFALQERGDDGTWGERLLPARRFFPAEGFVNRWANSTPIEVDSGVPFYVNTTEPTRSVTVDEYLTLCGGQGAWISILDVTLTDEQQALLDGDDIESFTWGLLFSVLDLGLTAMRTIEPPPALAEYHASQIGASLVLAQVVYLQPAEAFVSVWEAYGAALIAAGIRQAAEASLDPELRQRLTNSGCIGSGGSVATSSGESVGSS